MKPTSLLLALFASTAALTVTSCTSQPMTPAKPSAMAAAAPGAADSSSSDNHHTRSASGGSFDFYLLTLSWSPEFCLSHQAVECAAHPGFVLHGLWPQANVGPFLENCSNAPGPANPSQYSDIFPDVGLLNHEWKTHGTCSGLSPDAYFALARKAVHSVTIPTNLAGATPPPSLTPGALLSEFAGANPASTTTDFAVSCGSNHLTAMQACFTKDLQPVSCSTVKTCHANVVKITPPGARQ